MDFKTGQWALFRNEWAFVTAVTDKEVWLSGWNGIKTTVVRKNKIDAVTDSRPHESIQSNPDEDKGNK